VGEGQRNVARNGMSRKIFGPKGRKMRVGGTTL